MQKKPFLILGVNESTATQSELYEAYQTKRGALSNDRFLEGEAGAEAARKISELDEAYTLAADILATHATISDSGDLYKEISKLISEGNFSIAQNKLDDMSTRTGEWHYFQSVLYYKKGWHLESLKQLEMALNLEPNNAKYKEAKEKIDIIIKNPSSGTNNQQNTAGAQGSNRSYGVPGNPDVNNTCGTSANCCTNLICADCCCECMGGDLISCC